MSEDLGKREGGSNASLHFVPSLDGSLYVYTPSSMEVTKTHLRIDELATASPVFIGQTLFLGSKR